MGAGNFFRKVGVPIIGWFFGNIAWWSITKGMDETAMVTAITMIGFLILIVVGVIGIGWYFLRERRSLTTTDALENMARWVTLMYFAQKYNVSPDELGGLDTPQAVEERARRLQVERKLAKLEPPQQ